MYFLIISGMSGAGKSRAVATLEDLGYYCVDNLPIALIPRFAEVCLAATERYERVALVTDVRAGGDFQQLFDSLDSIRDMGCDYRILFLDTDTATLIRRYKETRRKHPLMDNGVSMPVSSHITVAAASVPEPHAVSAQVVPVSRTWTNGVRASPFSSPGRSFLSSQIHPAASSFRRSKRANKAAVSRSQSVGRG